MMRAFVHPPARFASLCCAAACCAAWLVGCGPEEPPQSGPGQLGPQSTQNTAAMEAALKLRLADNPDDADAHLALGNLYYDSDRPHRAIEEYQKVLEAGPCSPNVRTDIRTCYKKMNQLDKARAEYEHVLKDHRKHVNATFNLAAVTRLQGDLPGAADLWERAAALASDPRAAKSPSGRRPKPGEPPRPRKPATKPPRATGRRPRAQRERRHPSPKEPGIAPTWQV